MIAPEYLPMEQRVHVWASSREKLPAWQASTCTRVGLRGCSDTTDARFETCAVKIAVVMDSSAELRL